MTNANENQEPNNRKRWKFYTALIFLSGSLLCVSFGTMLGWASPTYFKLLGPNPYFPITIEQSALISGMLMDGFSFSTPFSGCDCLGSKLGVLLGAALMLAGWLVMIFATDMLGLCVSRMLVGLGGGFGIGKFKFYLKEICDPEKGIFLQKLLPLFVCVGITTSFSIGPFVSFKMLAIIAAVIPGLAFLTFTFVPDTPYHLMKQKKLAKAVTVLQNLHGKQCVDDEVENIKNFVENKPENVNIFQVLKDKHTRKSFVVLTFLITIQQFIGSPSLIVYSQIIFTEFDCPYPEFCSIIYSIVFLFSNGVGIRFTPMFRRKPTILLSLFGVILTSSVLVAYLYFKPEDKYYTMIPFVTMLLYAFCHTAGIYSITGLVVNDIFPENARFTMSCYWNIYIAELAVIVTKIFQVLYSQYGMMFGFVLYTGVGIFGFFVVALFMTETRGKVGVEP